MAIRTVVTRGYGNGTFNGTIPLVTLRGYGIGAAVEEETRSTNLFWREKLKKKQKKIWEEDEEIMIFIKAFLDEQ